MLYDSDSYVVVHIETPVVEEAAGVPDERHTLTRKGFEIVDKRAGKEVYLDGSWAEMFQQQIAAWQEKTPTEEEVETTLERYAQLAQMPVILH
jgi:hypothetical protein